MRQTTSLLMTVLCLFSVTVLLAVGCGGSDDGGNSCEALGSPFFMVGQSNGQCGEGSGTLIAGECCSGEGNCINHCCRCPDLKRTYHAWICQEDGTCGHEAFVCGTTLLKYPEYCF